MRARLWVFAATLQLALGVASCDRRLPAGNPTSASSSSSASAQPAPEVVEETIESSGLILGIGIGMPLTEARAKLDPLRVPGEHEPDRKEQAGTRIYRKLSGTDYDWIIVWANKAGQITRVRANPRPDKLKPFSQIGDLSRAASSLPQQATWNVERPGGLSDRLIAQGENQLARSVYMFALGLDMR